MYTRARPTIIANLSVRHVKVAILSAVPGSEIATRDCETRKTNTRSGRGIMHERDSWGKIAGAASEEGVGNDLDLQ